MLVQAFVPKQTGCALHVGWLSQLGTVAMHRQNRCHGDGWGQRGQAAESCMHDGAQQQNHTLKASILLRGMAEGMCLGTAGSMQGPHTSSTVI